MADDNDIQNLEQAREHYACARTAATADQKAAHRTAAFRHIEQMKADMDQRNADAPQPKRGTPRSAAMRRTPGLAISKLR